MTRKQALHKAIEALKAQSENRDIIAKLREIEAEMPLNHWTKRAIVDAVEQFIADNGRNPTATDFKRKGMPPHTVIRARYGVTLNEWLEKNYPSAINSYELRKKLYTSRFISDYKRIGPQTADDFDKNRTPGTVSWQTLKSYYNVTSWYGLLTALGLPFERKGRARRPHGDIRVNLRSELFDELRKLDEEIGRFSLPD